MGQAPVDLPDPMEQSSAVSAANADDLLSQLAGDEIDRLLAETEKTSAPSPAARSSVDDDGPLPKKDDSDPLHGLPEPEEAAAQVSAQLDELFAELNTPENEEAGSPQARRADRAATAAPITQATKLDKQLVDEATRLLDEEEEPQKEPPPADLSADNAAAGPGAENKAAAKNELDEEDPRTTSAERDALAEGEGDELTVGDLLASLPPAEESESGSVPALLKPLEWINAPLAACPDALREALGKVALLTLANAAAVIAYVLIFGRR